MQIPDSLVRSVTDYIVSHLTLSVDGREGYANGELVYHGRTYRVGGGYIHTPESASHANSCAGLQPETHPEMHWPGAAFAGDLRPYTGEDIGDWESLAKEMIACPCDPDERRGVILSALREASLAAFRKLQGEQP